MGRTADVATKRNPGAYDCYHHALPDEPLFVLLARDATAPDLVDEWALRRVSLRNGVPDSELDQIIEAHACAAAMRSWRAENDGAWRDPRVAEQWARVEIMGHRRHYGRVSEIQEFGVRLLLVEVPTSEAAVFIAHKYAGAAIFSIRPCSEDEAREEELATLPAPHEPALPEPVA
jgi:hypothetical protein